MTTDRKALNCNHELKCIYRNNKMLSQSTIDKLLSFGITRIESEYDSKNTLTGYHCYFTYDGENDIASNEKQDNLLSDFVESSDELSYVFTGDVISVVSGNQMVLYLVANQQTPQTDGLPLTEKRSNTCHYAFHDNRCNLCLNGHKHTYKQHSNNLYTFIYGK